MLATIAITLPQRSEWTPCQHDSIGINDYLDHCVEYYFAYFY